MNAEPAPLGLGAIRTETRYQQPGRPPANSPSRQVWRFEAQVNEDQQRLDAIRRTQGKYVIATNVLDQQQLMPPEMLAIYQEQSTSVERGFRFLKDPLFFAHSLFLKKPSHIMSLLMVMGLSLLIYALVEYHLRHQLVDQDQIIPDQKGKPTQNPTMRRAFQMFEGIHMLLIQSEHFRKRMVTNVTAVHLQIARLLGEPILKFYTFDDDTP